MGGANNYRDWTLQRMNICAEFGRKLDETSCFIRTETQAQIDATENLVKALQALINEDARYIFENGE